MIGLGCYDYIKRGVQYSENSRRGSDKEETPNVAVRAAYQVFKAFTDEDPKRDQMWIYPFVKQTAR